MSGAKNFDLYVKKSMFSILIIGAFLGICFYFADVSKETTLDDFESTMVKYKAQYSKMEDEVRRTKKRFNYFVSQLSMINSQKHKIDCTNDVNLEGTTNSLVG